MRLIIKNLLIILIVFAFTFAIAFYERSKVADFYYSADEDLMVAELPPFEFRSLESNEIITKESYSPETALMIHFWGTWCGPCIPELPQIIRLAERLEDKNIKFLLIAVNDKRTDVEKFLTRFKNLPSNIVVLLDIEGSGMTSFGTVKVPESYLYMQRKSAKRYIGPQEWDKPYYFTQLSKIL